MADEIKLSAKITVTKNGSTNSLTFTEDGLTMTGNVVTDSTVSVGTSAETLEVGEVSSPGYLVVWNLDATNYVEVDAVNTFNSFPQKIPAGQIAILRPQTTTIYLKANTAACLVRSFFLSL